MTAFREDAPSQRLADLLAGASPDPLGVRSVEAVWEALRRKDFDVLVIERALLPSPARGFLRELRSLTDPPGVIVLSSDERPEERAELLAAGVVAVLWLGLADAVLREALLSVAGRYGNARLERLGAERSEKRSTLDDFASASPTMQRFLSVARRVVDGESALLILGETGVGKERLARSIHSESERSAGPFVTVHCGAIPETLLESELFGHERGAFTGAERGRRGFFELAHRGTVFLDEIGEMPLHLQVKLLRALEDRRIRRLGGESWTEIDVRVMAATNRNLETEVEAGRFRPDLYYRLAVVTLTVPPLRERLEDLPALAEGFLARSRRKLGRDQVRFHPQAMRALLRHDWPGNVRELINVIERAALLTSGPEVVVSDLHGDAWERAPAAASAPTAAINADTEGETLPLFATARDDVLREFERRYLERLLADTHGRVGEAARRAGLNSRTLYGMMKRHGLRKEDFRGARASGSR